jgi:hypothetical protein
MTHVRSGLCRLILGSVLTISAVTMVAAQDQVPVLNVDATCRGGETTAAGFGRGPDVCRRTELEARDQLVNQWSEFPSPDRRRCVQLATMTEISSYVQILTCLEMAREARNLPDRRERSTVGSGR